MSENKNLLSTETIATIDYWLKKYPEAEKRSAVIAALTAAQKQNEGWLSPEIMDAVAEYLELPKVWIYEVASFYDMYDLKAVGKHKIRVCTSISCMLRGVDKIVDRLQTKLGIGFDETSADGLFTLKESECLAACVGAPMMQVDLDYYEKLTPEKVDEILNKVKEVKN